MGIIKRSLIIIGLVLCASVGAMAQGQATVIRHGASLPTSCTALTSYAFYLTTGTTGLYTSYAGSSVCSWTIAGGGGSGTISSCATSDAIPYYSASTTITCDAGITTNGSGQLSATGGFSAVADGTHAGLVSVTGNTTVPSIPSNSFGFIGPNTMAFTSWVIQPSTTAIAPTASCLIQLATAVSSVAALTCPSPAFTARSDGATVTWNIASALIANSTLTFTVHGGSRTLNIQNPVNGGNYVIWLQQDATGGEGLTLGTGCTWKVSGGGSGAITPSTGANAIDVLAFTYDGTNCYANFNKNFN